MDTKELVTDRYGRREANVEHNANEPALGARQLDLHVRTATPSLRLKNGKFEVQQTLSRGQWGATQDDAGRIYRNTNESALHVDLVPTPYFARNPNLLRTRGSYESLGGDNGDVNIVWPVRPNAGVNRGYQAGIAARRRHAGEVHRRSARRWSTAAIGCRRSSTATSSSPSRRPTSSAGIVVTDDGTTLRARKAYERGEFLASTDERFRPVYLSTAPDGTLYIVDMYRGIIQHRAYITEYLRDHIVARKLEQPIGLGRIYRVVHDTTRRDAAPALARARRRSWWQRCRIRTAGGAIPRSGCWSSAATSASDAPALADLVSRLTAHRLARRGCTRCGRSTASTHRCRRR